MTTVTRLPLCLATGILLAGLISASAAKNEAAADPSKTDADYAFQGEYAGVLAGQFDVGAQVIALGGGKFRLVLYPGGLPGAGYDGAAEKRQYDGARDGDTVTFTGGTTGKSITGGKLTFSLDGQESVIDRTVRKSPTLAAKPPEGALVLFDGKSAENFKPGRITESGLLMQGANSIKKFQGHKLHIEFRLPYEPTKRGQARGNSGCYMQARYEVQMLDSFGLAGKHNECGGIYTIADPDVNMCLPPLQWQTYDIDFTAAKYDKDGKKNRQRPRHRAPQRRADPRQRRAAQAHHRQPAGRGPGSGLPPPAGPRQPSPLPQYLGHREITPSQAKAPRGGSLIALPFSRRKTPRTTPPA